MIVHAVRQADGADLTVFEGPGGGRTVELRSEGTWQKRSGLAGKAFPGFLALIRHTATSLDFRVFCQRSIRHNAVSCCGWAIPESGGFAGLWRCGGLCLKIPAEWFVKLRKNVALRRPRRDANRSWRDAEWFQQPCQLTNGDRPAGLPLRPRPIFHTAQRLNDLGGWKQSMNNEICNTGAGKMLRERKTAEELEALISLGVGRIIARCTALSLCPRTVASGGSPEPSGAGAR